MKIELLIMMVLMLLFSYIDHKDNKYNEITISAEKFIMILLRHLLPSQYKIISILLHFNRDPYFCPHCNIMRKFVALLN